MINEPTTPSRSRYSLYVSVLLLVSLLFFLTYSIFVIQPRNNQRNHLVRTWRLGTSGNTTTAKTKAEQLKARLKAAHGTRFRKFVQGAYSIETKEAFTTFKVFCQSGAHGHCFVVEISDLEAYRNYGRENADLRELLLELVWQEAREIIGLEGRLGLFIYDSRRTNRDRYVARGLASAERPGLFDVDGSMEELLNFFPRTKPPRD